MEILNKCSLYLLILSGLFFLPSCLERDIHAKGKSQNPLPADKRLIKKDSEWKKALTTEQFYILREKGTERPFTGSLLKNKKKGLYVCAACEHELFSSQTKYNSGTGWPSFYEPVAKTSVYEKSDHSYGMNRIELLCARCEGHLGHIFPDGPPPTGLRYCINSVSLKFIQK